MPRTKETIPYYQTLGGLVTRKSDTLVTGNEAMVAQNTIFDVWGAQRQRDGSANLLAAKTGNRERLIFQHQERLTQEKTMLVVDGVNVSKKVGTSLTILASDFTPSDELCTADQLFDDTIICSGLDAPKIFNLNGLADLDTTFRPQWCINYKNFMFYGGDPALPLRLGVSALGDAKQLNINNDFIDILDAGPFLTGAFILFNSLWITTVKDIIKIDGSDFQASSAGFDAQVRTVWRGSGAVNHQTITIAHDHAYMVGKYAVFQFDGREAIDISSQITPFFINDLNKSKVTRAASVHDEENNVVILSVPSPAGGDLDTHLIYHYEEPLKSWALWNGFSASCWASIDEAGEFPFIHHGTPGGQINRHSKDDIDDIDDDGVAIAIDWQYRSGWETGGEPEKRKLFKFLYPIVIGQPDDTFDVSVFFDYEQGAHTGFPVTVTIPTTGPVWGVPNWGAFNWGGADAAYVAKIGSQARVARNFSYLFKHKTLGRRFQLTGWTTVVVPKGFAQ